MTSDGPLTGSIPDTGGIAIPDTGSDSDLGRLPVTPVRFGQWLVAAVGIELHRESFDDSLSGSSQASLPLSAASQDDPLEDKSVVDWSVPDWRRETPRRFWDPSRKLLQSIRDYQRLSERGPINRLLRKLCVVRHRFWSVVSGAEIPLSCQLGGGLMLPHPNGVVCHPSASIGVNCLLFQQVTITEAVELGYHVDIGAGAKLLPRVRVGNGARIGANAVVIDDVPAEHTAVGIPARIVRAEREVSCEKSIGSVLSAKAADRPAR